MKISISKGYTLIEIIIIIVIAGIVGAYIAEGLQFSWATVEMSDEHLSNVLKLQSIFENITYDYTYRCYREPMNKENENNDNVVDGEFTIDILKMKIGDEGQTISSQGNYTSTTGGYSHQYPYGFHPGNGYISYYVKKNRFVNEERFKNTIFYQFNNFIYEHEPRILLVTLQIRDSDNIDKPINPSLTVLFTEKDHFNIRAEDN